MVNIFWTSGQGVTSHELVIQMRPGLRASTIRTEANLSLELSHTSIIPTSIHNRVDLTYPGSLFLCLLYLPNMVQVPND